MAFAMRTFAMKETQSDDARAHVVTYFMYVRKLGTNGLLRKNQRSRMCSIRNFTKLFAKRGKVNLKENQKKIFGKSLLSKQFVGNNHFWKIFLFDFLVDFLRSNHQWIWISRGFSAFLRTPLGVFSWAPAIYECQPNMFFFKAKRFLIISSLWGDGKNPVSTAF